MKDKLIFGFEIGQLCGEEIAIESLVDIKKLTEGDPDPFFATVKALRVGKSGNKKNFSMENLKQVLAQLPLYGYKGHIKEEEISYRFREPVTSWIGGKIIEDWLYVKGYISPQHESLRKDVALSLKVGRPMPVSILGFMKLKKQGEYYDVLDINMLSIDWANPGVEGIKGTQVIEVGKEQAKNQTTKEDDMPTKEEILAALTKDEIKTARPDLVGSIQSEMQESDEAKKQKEKDKTERDTLEKENKDLKKQVIDTHRDKLLAEIQDENIRGLAGDLLQGETTEELDKNWKLVKEKLGKFEKSGMPIISGKTDEKKPGSEFIEDRLLSDKKEA